MIPYGRHEITPADIDAVVDVLQSDFLTQGPVVPLFEKAVAEYCGVQHVVAVNSATSALHVACLALGLGSGDWMWTSPITFVASANCGRYCGAHVDFVDIDPRTYNLCPRALERKLLQAGREGRLPKVVVPVHFSGQSCEMAAIHALSQQYGFKIIEDASHAIGGKYKEEPVGSCRFSDIAVFSFHPVKIITAAEGGMALTKDRALATKMSLLRSHGITRDPSQMTHDPDGPWYYQQVELGFNYRMTELQAALGMAQMRRLDHYVARRHQIARRYDQMLSDLPITIPWQREDGYSAMHLYVIRLRRDLGGMTQRRVFDSMREQGIGVNLHYIPVYRQPYYQQMGFREAECPEAERYYSEAITLPMFPTISDAQQNEVVYALRRALSQ